MKKAIVTSSATALAFLFAAATAQAYVYDKFEGSAHASWANSSGVIVSNGSGAVRHDGSSLYIPTLSSITNMTSSGTVKVWTDFYTVPRPYTSDSGTAPAVDANATAQFFVNSNGMWVTISGNGAGGLLTNVCDKVLVSGVQYPTVTTYEALYHVSVLHDYTSTPKTWGLFVEDFPIATNLLFINTNVTSHAWFQAQNLGGSSTNVCWLDDFMVTNSVPAAGENTLTNTIEGTDITLAEAYMGFGSFEDPRPTNETVGVAGTTVNLDFGKVVADGRKYVVLGTAQYSLSGLSSNGLLDVNGLYADNTLAGGATRRYYRIATVSSDGSVVVTNDETYAAFKQYRSPSATFIIGVPVQYADPADRTMARAMGDQLMAGLQNGDQITITTNGVDYLYTLNAGEWTSAQDNPPTKIWGPGVGMVVKRGAAGGSTSSVLAGLKDTNAVQVAVANNTWSYLTWPHNDKAFNNGAALGFSASTSDYIYIQTNGAPNFIPARFNGTVWKTQLNGLGPALSLTLQPGDGIIYRTAGGSKVFSSEGP